jgi:hypothetical protein
MENKKGYFLALHDREDPEGMIVQTWDIPAGEGKPAGAVVFFFQDLINQISREIFENEQQKQSLSDPTTQDREPRR